MKKFLILTIPFIVKAEIKTISWLESLNTKSMKIADSEYLSDEFDGIKIQLTNSTYVNRLSSAPIFISFDYELETCPAKKSFENTLNISSENGLVEIGKYKYWFAANKCKLFVTLKSPFINNDSFFIKNE